MQSFLLAGITFDPPMLIALAVFFMVISALAFEWIDKTVAVLLGAFIIGATGATPFSSMIDLVDFSTILLLLGLMLMVEVVNQSKVLDWLNVQIIRYSKGNPLSLFLVFSLLTFFLSTFLANATTMLILVPLTITVTRAMGISPKPYIIAEIFFSVIGGTLTIIGDPANVMIASASGLGFLEFSSVMIMPIAFVVVLFLGILITLFWSHVRPISRSLGKLFITNMLIKRIEHQFLSAKFNLVFALITITVFIIVILAMIFELGNIPIEYLTLGGAAVMLILTQRFLTLHKIFSSIDVHTLLFFAGLFIVVGTLEHTGVLSILSNIILHYETSTETFAFIILWTVGLLSAFIENIPLVAIMIPVILSIIDSGSLTGDVTILWYALSLGACLGGNGSLVGSSANILGAQLAAKNGVKISFFEFFWIGYPLTILSLMVGTVFILLSV